MSGVIFEDPFESVITASVGLGASARVTFVDRRDLPRLGGLRFWRRAKGATFWPDDDDLPIVMLDAGLRRGVQGTLDILAHELAHVIAGHDAGHGAEWAAAYAAIHGACMETPAIEREVQP